VVYSHEKREAFWITFVSVLPISIAGCIFILASFFMFKRLRTTFGHVIFMLTISDLCLSVACIFACGSFWIRDEVVTGWRCELIAFVLIYFCYTSVCWLGGIAATTWCIVCYEVVNFSWWHYLIVHTFCWVFPFIIALLPTLGHPLGEYGVKREVLCLFADGAEFYHGLYTLVIMTGTGATIIFCYTSVIIHVYKVKTSIIDDSVVTKPSLPHILASLLPRMTFLISYVVFWTGFILIAWVEFGTKQVVPYGVWIFFLVLPHMQGFANAVIYVWLQRVWRDWKVFICVRILGMPPSILPSSTSGTRTPVRESKRLPESSKGGEKMKSIG